ncbi:MAG: hypothetical protein J6R59_10720 [Paludibacteraceae bacterium]|nr:hypothetical protein [Paludibacteraceae bacterium]
MNKKQIELLAKDIHEYLVKHEMWVDVHIYFNGKCWSTNSKDNSEFCYNESKYFEFEDNPKKYFEYVAENHILSMSFEGSLYDVLNAYVPNWTKYEAEFRAIFTKYGLYYQLGNAWNLTCYEI